MPSLSEPRVPAPPPAGPRRLHPAALLLWPLRQVGPVALVVLLSGVPAVLALVLLWAVVASAVRYARFRWRVDAEAFVVEQGLVQQHRRVIPLQRIQSVEIVRGVRHRLLGVAEVRVEAIGGNATEGRLDALGLEEAQELRSTLLHRRGAGAAEGEAPDVAPLAVLTPGELVLAGATGGRVGVMAAVLGFLQEVAGERVARIMERLPGVLGGEGLVALGLVIVVAAFTLSVVATAVTYWGFTLWQDGGYLRIRRGLLDQRLETIPLGRVQALRVEENAARRLLGLAAVKADLAGRAGEESGRETGLVLPLATKAEAFALVARILDMPDVTAVQLERMPDGARHRRVGRALAFTVVVTAAAAGGLGWPGLAAAVVAVPALGLARAAYSALGWARTGRLLVTRAGVAVRKTAFVPVGRVQSLAVVASPLQRRRRLGTLELHIARSVGVWRGPQAIDLEGETATRLLAMLAAELAETPQEVRA